MTFKNEPLIMPTPLFRQLLLTFYGGVKRGGCSEKRGPTVREGHSRRVDCIGLKALRVVMRAPVLHLRISMML